MTAPQKSGEERMLREKSNIVEGNRVLGEADSTELKQCEA